MPIHLSEDWNLITRTIFPLTWQPALAPGTGSTFGLGDVNLSLFLSPKELLYGIIRGVGPAIILPTATSGKVGSNIWGAGPSPARNKPIRRQSQKNRRIEIVLEGSGT